MLCYIKIISLLMLYYKSFKFISTLFYFSLINNSSYKLFFLIYCMNNSNDNKGSFDWKDNSIEWKDIIKKEARGYEKGDDLGEVQDIGLEFVVTERGRLEKHNFYLPKHLVKDMMDILYGSILQKRRQKIILKKTTHQKKENILDIKQHQQPSN